MGENIIRASICLFLLALAILTVSSCGNGGGGTSTQEEGSDTATLSWEAPTTNADGTPIDDLAGFKVYYGTTSPISKDNSTGIEMGNTTTYTLSELTHGTYYFTVTALDFSGNESDFSEEVSKEISGM